MMEEIHYVFLQIWWKQKAAYRPNWAIIKETKPLRECQPVEWLMSWVNLSFKHLCRNKRQRYLVFTKTFSPILQA